MAPTNQPAIGGLVSLVVSVHNEAAVLESPMKLMTAASFMAVLYLINVFVQKLLGYTVEGWATIMVAMLFLGSVQLICLGIRGEYLARISNEVKPRPMYIIEKHLTAGLDPST